MAPSKSASNEKSLKELADSKLHSSDPSVNPSQLGDPISLKAETSNRSPTEQDGGARGTSHTGGQRQQQQGQNKEQKSGGKSKDDETLAEKVKKNPTALGDPVSLKAEESDRPPKEEEEGAKSDAKKDKSKL